MELYSRPYNTTICHVVFINRPNLYSKYVRMTYNKIVRALEGRLCCHAMVLCVILVITKARYTEKLSIYTYTCIHIYTSIFIDENIFIDLFENKYMALSDAVLPMVSRTIM